MIQQHYGRVVDSEVPITGVFTAHNLQFIYDEPSINYDYMEHIRKCRKREHDDCFWWDGDSTEMIGFRRIKGGKNRGLWGPDPKAEFSAIVHENIVQVVKSDWVIRCALCSPCYPGQGDGDTPGNFLAYAPPPDLISLYEDNPLRQRVFPIKR